MRYQNITSWLKNISLAVAALFFLLLGVDLLVASYSLANPLAFIVTFFASSLIILISLTGLIFCIFSLGRLLHEGKGESP